MFPLLRSAKETSRTWKLFPQVDIFLHVNTQSMLVVLLNTKSCSFRRAFVGESSKYQAEFKFLRINRLRNISSLDCN